MRAADGGAVPNLSRNVAAAVGEAYRELGGGPVAARSSATVEDSATASFAGQHAKLLNVEGADAITDAIGRCWASAGAPEAIAYRAHAGMSEAEFAIAAVVQRMVAADRSGVLFTANPVNSDAEVLVIEAAAGLGEGLASGRTTPDHYVVDRETGVVRKRRPAGETDLLTEAEISELQELSRSVERVFTSHTRTPQDIEWAQADGGFLDSAVAPDHGPAGVGDSVKQQSTAGTTNVNRERAQGGVVDILRSLVLRPRATGKTAP